MKSKYFQITSIVIYTISLSSPIYFPKELNLDAIMTNDLLGFQALGVGWMTFPYVDFFCWLANFTLLASWILFKKSYANYIVSIGTVLAFLYGINHVTQWDFIVVHEYDLNLFGYWFWIVAMLLQIVATRLYQNEKNQILNEE